MGKLRLMTIIGTRPEIITDVPKRRAAGPSAAECEEKHERHLVF